MLNGPRSVLHKSSGCEGPAEAFPRRQRMWGACWYFTHTTYQCPWLLIIDYCYFKLYTTTLHHYLSLIIATPSYALLHYITTYHWLFLPWAMYWCIMIKTITHAETWLMFAIDHCFTHCPRAYCKKLQHQYIEQKKREIHWDKDNVLRIWGRNTITLQLYRKIKAIRARQLIYHIII